MILIASFELAYFLWYSAFYKVSEEINGNGDERSMELASVIFVFVDEGSGGCGVGNDLFLSE